MKELCVILAVICSGLAVQSWPDPDCPDSQFNEVRRFPYFGNCSLFWECYKGSKYWLWCPQGQQFNAELEQCVEPSKSHCHSDASVDTTNICDGHSGDKAAYLPYPGDCRKYVICFKGNTYVNVCPDGLYWGQQNQKCGPKDEADCAPSTTSSAVTTTSAPPTTTASAPPATTSSAPPTTSTRRTTSSKSTAAPRPTAPVPQECPQPNNAYLPYPGDCSKFYECSDGKKIPFSCPFGLYWNQDKSRCDYPQNVDCDYKTTTRKTATTRSIPVDYCLEPDNTFLPCSEDCTKYYVCTGGKKTQFTCPHGLDWNQKICKCDYPENADCHENV